MSPAAHKPPHLHTPRVVAVIPVHDSRAWLDTCLTALIAQDGVDLELVVVDNDSADGSTADLLARWPQVDLVRCTENLGYGAAINLGAQRHPELDVLALNVDTEPTAGALRALADLLERSPSVGVAAPRLVEFDGAVQRSSFRFPTLTRMLAEAVFLDRIPIIGRRIGYALADENWRAPTPIDWATGAALLVRREAWDDAGGFDPGYFFYVEDIDLQHRLARRGWTTVHVPQAVVRHAGRKPPMAANRLIHLHRGYARYFRTQSGEASALCAIAVLRLTALTRALAWTALALVRPRRRDEARKRARTFWDLRAASSVALSPGQSDEQAK